MKVLLVHPSALLYSQVYLRLEPLGMEYVASALREAGHEVQLIDLQIFRQHHFEKQLRSFRPDAVGFSVNYLPNVPEVIDLAKRTKELSPEIFVFLGGHTAFRSLPRRCCVTATVPSIASFRERGNRRLPPCWQRYPRSTPCRGW